MGSELAVIGQHESNSVAEYHRKATDVAGAVKALVVGQAITLGKRKYLPVAAYQAVANAMGCTTSARDVQKVEGGYTAIGEVKRLSDGAVIATGEGFVGMDEEKWAKGPEYARRAMVQTRAIGRACRAAFAFVVPMIDGGLETTPHEEVAGLNLDGKAPPPAPLGVEKLRQAATAKPTTPAGDVRKLEPSEPPPHTDADAPGAPEDAQVVEHAAHDRAQSFGFGKSKGVPLAEIDENSLTFYRSAFKRDLADQSPEKAKWHGKTTLQLAAVEAELRFRGLPT